MAIVQSKPFEVATKGLASCDDLANILQDHISMFTEDEGTKLSEIFNNISAMASVIESLSHLLSHVNKPALEEAMRDHMACMMKVDQAELH